MMGCLETQSEKKTAAAESRANALAFVKWLNGIILAPALFVSLCYYISSDLSVCLN